MPAGLQNKKANLDFLETIGNRNKGDAMPLGGTAKALIQLAGFLIDTATDNLERNGNEATGGTASSMQVANVDLSGARMSVDVEIVKTYKFLDQGVRGYAGGKGKYQFKKPNWGRKKGGGKSKKPPLMVQAIMKWLKVRSLSGKTKYKAYGTNLKTGGKGGTENKNKKINEAVSSTDSLLSLAYAVSQNIKKNGIKPTYFFTNAIKATQKETRKRFAEALKVDIINSFN